MTARIDLDGLDGIVRSPSTPAPSTSRVPAPVSSVIPRPGSAASSGTARALSRTPLPVPPPAPSRPGTQPAPVSSLFERETELMPPPDLPSAPRGSAAAPREGAREAPRNAPPDEPTWSDDSTVLEAWPRRAEESRREPAREVAALRDAEPEAASGEPPTPPPAPPLPPAEPRRHLRLVVGALSVTVVGVGALWLSSSVPVEPTGPAKVAARAPIAASPVGPTGRSAARAEPLPVETNPVETNPEPTPEAAASPEPEAPSASGSTEALPVPTAAPSEPARVALVQQPARRVEQRFPATFRFNSVEPARVRGAELAALVEELRGCEGPIVIRGHTCNIGDSAANLEAGLLRAEKVRALLEEAGLADREMRVESGGDREPAASNRTRKGRFANRRVMVTCGHATAD